MKTVEYLMVSKAGHPHRSIRKTSVNGLVHGHEGYIASALLKDSLQTLGLLGTIGKDKELISTPDKVGERLLYQFKILMEERLG